MIRSERYKYVHRLYESGELYDSQTDPAKRNNRIGDPELVDILDQLKKRLSTSTWKRPIMYP